MQISCPLGCFGQLKIVYKCYHLLKQLPNIKIFLKNWWCFWVKTSLKRLVDIMGSANPVTHIFYKHSGQVPAPPPWSWWIITWAQSYQNAADTLSEVSCIMPRKGTERPPRRFYRDGRSKPSAVTCATISPVIWLGRARFVRRCLADMQFREVFLGIPMGIPNTLHLTIVTV